MNLEELKRAGIRFDFCPNAVAPEIPYVQDVLFALRLTDEQKNYDFCAANHVAYIVNVALVVAAVGYGVLCMEPYDQAEAKKIIARAIIELCPEEAKCLFQSAYMEAKRIVGEEIPPADTACTCPRCNESGGDGCDDCRRDYDEESWEYYGEDGD